MILFFSASLLLIFYKPKSTPHEKIIRAGVVAGFLQPFNEIASEFYHHTGIKIEPTFTSAGKLYWQVVNGALYDIILADEKRAELLLREGYAEKPFVYAIGEVVLWSKNYDYCKLSDWKEVLWVKGIRVAIANPEVAVYGDAAKKVMQRAGLWHRNGLVLITALDLAQVFQYASTGAVDAGFCNNFQAGAEPGKQGCVFPVNEAPGIVHSGCIVKNRSNKENIRKFADFLISADAERIKKKYGYK